MATATILYNKFFTNLMNKEIDLEADTIKAALVDNTYTPDRDHDTFETGSDPFDSEVAGAGYTAGGATLANCAVTQSDATDRTYLDADDVTWPTVTVTFRYIIIWDDSLTNDDLIACIDMGEDIVKIAADLTLQWDTDGIFGLADLTV